MDDLSSSLSGSDAITARSSLTVLWSELWRQAGSSGSIASQLDRILQVGATSWTLLILEVFRWTRCICVHIDLLRLLGHNEALVWLPLSSEH